MDIPQKILRLVRTGASSIASTGPLYKEVAGLDKDELVSKLGQALMLLSDIDDAIIELHPDMVADQRKLIEEDPAAFDAEYDKLDCAIEAENSGGFEEAKRLFSEIEDSSKIEDNRVRAQAGLYRVCSKS